MSDALNFGDPLPGKTASSAIAVKAYELFLVWPVFLQPMREDGRCIKDKFDPNRHKNFLDHWVEYICKDSPWKEREGPYPPLGGNRAAAAYSEFIYFHPFVRQFLYTTRGDIRDFKKKQERSGNYMDAKVLRDQATNRNLRILERNDLSKLVVKLAGSDTTFKVATVWLYLFDTQVAMLEVQLAHEKTVSVAPDGTQTPKDLKLDQVMDLNDCVRRASAAYWRVWENKVEVGPPVVSRVDHAAGHCPVSMSLIDQGGKIVQAAESAFGTFELTKENNQAKKDFELTRFDEVKAPAFQPQVQAVKDHLEQVYQNREQYTVPLFRTLLEPIGPTTLILDKQELPKSPPLRFEQILDERVPIFAFVAVDDPRRISEGDWVRLASIDDTGESQTYPYSPTFLKPEYLKDFFYDRFWHASGEPPGQKVFQCTRWLVSAYGFVGVGAADKDFFMNAHSGALAHFRHHYFALGLIANFHRASLLRFKHELAEAADELHEKDDLHAEMPKFQERVARLQREFLRFRTRYWFAEISNQVQGRELFDLWKKHLNTMQLFADVAADIDAAEKILRQQQEDRRNCLLLRIAIIAAIFGAVSPALSLAPDGPDGWKGPWCVMACVGALFLLLIAVCLFPTEMWRKFQESQEERDQDN